MEIIFPNRKLNVQHIKNELFVVYIILLILRTRSGKGKEEDVSGGLPQTTSTLIYLRCLCRQNSGSGGDGHPENDS